VTAELQPHRRSPLWSVGLVICGLICQDIGASFAVLLFPTAGALGMASLRVAFSAVVLLAICRPRLRGYSRSDWMTVVAFGLVVACMNVLFYETIARLPLGIAVTIEMLGPLVLSVAVSRRASAWLWAALAFVGVALFGFGVGDGLGGDGLGGLDPVGVLFGFGAAVMWAGYILASRRTGARFPKLDGLAIAMGIGAVATLPFGIASSGAALFEPHILLVGLAIAVLSSALPYGLELIALRRLPASAFSILMSLSPAIAATVGVVVLGQALSLVDAVAIVLVIAASAGAVRTASLGSRKPLAEAMP
jgi:inner membrane transporter RhtA